MYDSGARRSLNANATFLPPLQISRLNIYGEKVPQNKQVFPGIELALLNATQRSASHRSVSSDELIRLITCQSHIKDDTWGRAVFGVFFSFFLSTPNQTFESENEDDTICINTSRREAINKELSQLTPVYFKFNSEVCLDSLFIWNFFPLQTGRDLQRCVSPLMTVYVELT